MSLKVEDIAPHGYTIDRATVRQRKTGRPVKRILSDAYHAGHAAGARFEWRPGIEERVGN